MQKELRTQINNLELSIKSASADASRKSDITTIAVSKKKTIEHIKCAYDLGIRNFGENYAQELEEKARQLKLDKIIWHFIRKHWSIISVHFCISNKSITHFYSFIRRQIFHTSRIFS